MAVANILVVDSDEGFGGMLKEGLENSGYYTAKCVHTGRAALEAITGQAFDLIIIDLALTDMSPIKLIQATREIKPGMRIMIIPLIGQDLPDKVKSLNIHGVLTKPFFVGDLPALINQALGQRKSVPPTPPTPSVPAKAPPPSATKTPSSPVSPSKVAPAEPVAMQETVVLEDTADSTIAAVSPQIVRYLRGNEPEILRLLDDLNREVRAEAILLIAGVELIASAGMLSRTQCQELTLLVAQSSQAAAQAASFLGERAGRFAQSLHEGSEYRLYSLSLGQGILLSLALSSNVPLGMIRHQCRQIADQLSKYIN